MKSTEPKNFERWIIKDAHQLDVKINKIKGFLIEKGYDGAFDGSGLATKIVSKEAYLMIREEFADDTESTARIREVLSKNSEDKRSSDSTLANTDERQKKFERRYFNLAEEFRRPPNASKPATALVQACLAFKAEYDYDQDEFSDRHSRALGLESGNPSGADSDLADEESSDSESDGERSTSSLELVATNAETVEADRKDGKSERIFRPNPLLDTSFEEILSPTQFAKTVKNRTLNQLTSQIGDLSGIAFESLELAREEGRIYFSLSKDGRRLVEEGKAFFEYHKESGKYLPTIKSSKTEEYLEQVKGVKGGKLSSKLMKLGNMVVNAAHIVSGADVVRRLDEVASDTQFLVEARRIDQFAQLESIYDSCQEVIDLPDSKVREKLERQYEKLVKLRAQVRGDMSSKLGNVENPAEKGWFSHLFSTEKGRDREVVRETMNVVELGRFIEGSVLMQLALADRLGRLDRFLERTLPKEIDRLEKISDQIEECAEYVSGNHSDLDLDPALRYFNGISKRYEDLASSPEKSKLQGRDWN